MPIYEYRCADCGFQDEYLQKVTEPPISQCPTCGRESFRKLLSLAGFQLKGSGWYATDFKGNGSGPAAKPPGDDAKPEAPAKQEATPVCGQGACPACTN
jgi:putative FmdB family regulatory protein